MIVPSSNIILLKTPIEIDNINQLTFSNPTQQYNYFYNLPKLEYDKCTYQRKDGVIRYETNDDLTYEDLLQYNYCMYKNSKYSDKWFYAFITNCEYINDGMSTITIKTDVFQTWQHSINYKMSFVEREIIPKSEDTIGAFTYPENLETGEIICNGETADSNFDSYMNDMCYIIASSLNPMNSFNYAGGNVYNGVYSGMTFIRYDATTGSGGINSILEDYAKDGRSASISALFIAPKILCPETTPTSPTIVHHSYEPRSWDLSIAKNYGFQGYQPKNNKLRTYPFTYLFTTNNQGDSNILHYEHFSTPRCNFNVKGVLSVGCSIRMNPRNYKGVTINLTEGINLGKFPVCNYTTDSYTNWLSQNSINIAGKKVTTDQLNMANTVNSGVSSVLGNLMSGNIGGALQSAFGSGTSVAQNLIQQKQHELIPPSSSGNLNAGDVMTASGYNTFRFYHMSIKREFAEKIDSYFSAYGYAINQYKIPNLHSRRNWNYIKTNGLNITGNIPQTDLQEIKNIFNNGVTLWHNPATFLDYSQSND